ncbi:hypothetical protein TIFTF001_014915 [Ficus carica]|uniref:Ribosomal RNA small subunit methyltransferase G n=1 Tax=Ficus carica TaxID=3494 RepID=A0AA88D8H3_FICCA|nr:hypothetical protein TIFTF001_014915 [Ficus carica]
MMMRRSLPPFSLGTFFEHLPTAKPSTFSPLRFRPKSFSTTTFLKSSHFQTLNSSQQHQLRLYVDSLLQWNQVSLSLSLSVFAVWLPRKCTEIEKEKIFKLFIEMQKMNLTAVTEVSEVMERHVEDSLAIIPPIRNSYLSHCGSSFDNVKLVDVGSGAGLPGLILAIACPGWEVTLMESMNKRCVFLEHVIGHVGLPNVQVVRGRAEDQCFREKFDVAVARAVAEMRVLAEYCLPLVRVGGLFVAAKGHEPEVEVQNAERAIEKMGASVLQSSLQQALFVFELARNETSRLASFS